MLTDRQLEARAEYRRMVSRMRGDCPSCLGTGEVGYHDCPTCGGDGADVRCECCNRQIPLSDRAIFDRTGKSTLYMFKGHLDAYEAREQAERNGTR